MEIRALNTYNETEILALYHSRVELFMLAKPACRVGEVFFDEVERNLQFKKEKKKHAIGMFLLNVGETYFPVQSPAKYFRHK